MTDTADLSAFELTTLYTRQALGGASQGRESFLGRLTHLVGVVCNGWPLSPLDVRLESDGGELKVRLFTSIPAAQMAGLLEALPEQRWRELEPVERDRALAPFTARDTVLFQRAASEPVQVMPGGSTLWAVRPLGQGLSDWEALTFLARRHPQRWTLSVRVHPTEATTGETDFVLSQLAHVSVLHARVGQDTSALPVLTGTSEALLAWRARLDAACAQVTLTVVSEEALPLDLTYALRSWLAGDARLLERVALDLDEARAAVQGMTTLEPVLPAFGKAPQGLERLPLLYSPAELASLLPFPQAPERALLGLPCEEHAAVPLRAELSSGLRLGVADTDLRRTMPVCLDDMALARHVYVVGRTGTGKSTLLGNLAAGAMRDGRGLVVIDPHGDLYEELLERVPAERADDLVKIDPLDPGGHTLNPFDVTGDYARRVVAMEFGEIMQRLTEDEFGVQAGAFLGPVWHQAVRQAVLWVTSDPKRPGTLIDLYRVFTEKNHAAQWEMTGALDDDLLDWYFNQFKRVDYLQPNSDGQAVGPWIASKFQHVVFHPALRSFFGAPRSTVRLEDLLGGGKIVLVNLSKGRLGEPASRFLGMVFVHMLFQAFLKRAALPASARPQTLLLCDEFQSYGTQVFGNLLSEGRKYGAQLVLANQHLSQVSESIQHSLLGNVGSLVSFRVGPADAALLEREFAPEFTAAALSRLPNFTAAMRTMTDTGLVPPFTLIGSPPGEGCDNRKIEK